MRGGLIFKARQKPVLQLQNSSRDLVGVLLWWWQCCNAAGLCALQPAHEEGGGFDPDPRHPPPHGCVSVCVCVCVGGEGVSSEVLTVILAALPECVSLPPQSGL